MSARDADLLSELARRIDQLIPSHRRPEAFFEERSEIADELRRLARQAERDGRGGRDGY